MALGDQTDPVPVKQNDTLPTIQYAATQGPAKTPVSLASASVVFSMRSVTVDQAGVVTPGSVVITRAAGTVVDSTNGIMEYSPTPTWSATNGLYQAEFEVTFTGGKVITFPPGRNYIWIEVSDDIA